jgi:hypothetical protein
VALGYNDIAVADAVGAPIVGAVCNYSPEGTGDPNLPYVRTPLPEEVLGIEHDHTGAVAMQAPNVVAVEWLLGRLRPTLLRVAARQG